jgi:hypothetical protein
MSAILKELDAAVASVKAKIEAAIAANPKKAVIVAFVVGVLFHVL